MKKLVMLLACILLVALTILAAGCGKSNFEGKWMTSDKQGVTVYSIAPGNESDSVIIKKIIYRYDKKETFTNEKEYDEYYQWMMKPGSRLERMNGQGKPKVISEYLYTYTWKAGQETVFGTAKEKDGKLYVQGNKPIVLSLNKDGNEIISSDGGAPWKTYSDEAVNAVKDSIKEDLIQVVEKLNIDKKIYDQHFTAEFKDDNQ